MDLGVQADVQMVRIWNRADNIGTVNRGTGHEVVISTIGGAGYSTAVGALCAVNDTEMLNPPFRTNVTCVGSGRYVTVRAPVGQIAHWDEVEVYAASLCPLRNASFAIQLPGSQCNNAPFGAICVQQCLPGYTAVSGAQTSVCRGSSWDAPALVCQPTCPELPPPDYAEDCSKTMIAESFTQSINPLTLLDTTLDRWNSLDPNQPIGKSWFAVDNMLLASARWGCNGEMFLVATSLVIRDFQGTYTLQSNIYTSDRAGIVRALDKANYIRFYIDVIEGVHVLDRMANGVLTRLSDVTMDLAPNTWYTIALTQVGSTIMVSINGVNVLTALDKSLSVGYVGLYAGTQAKFDEFSMVTDCTSCAGAVPQDRCVFTCRPGLIQTGNASRTCTLAPNGLTADWSGVTSTCTLPPPVFNNGVRSVPENSVRNTAVGDPLVAYLASPDDTVSFALISTSPLPPGGVPFWVDRCSGQLRVKTPSVLDYEAYRSFSLNVSAYVQGFPNAVTFRTVTVNLINVNEAPIIAPNQVFNLSESASIGDIVGRVRYSDPENSTTTFNIVADASAGIVAFSNASDPALSVASTLGLNFESGTTSYSVVISARDAYDATLSTSGVIYLQVIDGPDLPLLRASQTLRITDTTAVVGAAFPDVIVASLEDNPFGTWNSTLRYALLPSDSAAVYCPVNESEAATTTGVTGSGAPLFSVDALTGTLRVAAFPAVYPGWTSRPTFALDGSFARAAYTLCVNVSSRYRWAVGPVRAAVVASLAGTARITGYQVGDGVNGTSMDTLAPAAVSFFGSDMGAPNGTAVITANYSNADRTLVFTATCAVVSNNLITCQPSRGVGADLAWNLYRDGERIPSTVTITTSYFAPVVTGISNHTGIPSEGNQNIILTGRYFGAVDLGQYYAMLEYGPSPTNLKYNCRITSPPQWGDMRDSQALCIADRGAGAGLVWRLTVGGQTVSSSGSDASQLIGYMAPVVTSIELAAGTGNVTGNATALSRLDTRGNTRLIIRGSGFGGDPTDVISVTYTKPNQASSPVFTMTGCDRLTPTTTTAISCLTAPGVGSNLALTVVVEGQASAVTSGNVTRQEGISYAPPIIRSVGGSFKGMSTNGGDGESTPFFCIICCYLTINFKTT